MTSEDDANMVCGWAQEFMESAEKLLSEREH